jgi:hypothetical protein
MSAEVLREGVAELDPVFLSFADRELLSTFNVTAGRDERVELLDAAVSAVCAELLTSRAVKACLVEGPRPPVPPEAKAVFKRATHPALPVHMLSLLSIEPKVRAVLLLSDTVTALGLSDFWHVPPSRVSFHPIGAGAGVGAGAGAGAGVAAEDAPGGDASALDLHHRCRSPLTLPVVGHRVPLPEGDPGLVGLLALRPAYHAIARLIAAASTTTAAIVEWAGSIATEAARWQGRTHLLLALYEESFSPQGTPCLAVAGALLSRPFLDALFLTQAEASVYALLARGHVVGSSKRDGLRHLFSAEAARDPCSVRLRAAAVHAMAIALGVPRGHCYAHMVCFEQGKAVNSMGLGSDHSFLAKDVRVSERPVPIGFCGAGFDQCVA